MSKAAHTALAATMAAILLSSTAHARTIEVNTGGDHRPRACTRSECTLREAVIAANKRDGRDTIVLPGAPGPYNMRLESTGEDAAADGDLDITSGPLTIRAKSDKRRPEIDAHGIDRIFDIGAARTRIVGLELTNGLANKFDAGGDGGAIVVGDIADAPVTIVDSLIVDNRALGFDANGGAIDSDSSELLRVIDTTVQGNVAGGDGGGITASFDGPVSIERSWLVGNTAGEGGGLMAVGPVSVTDSTIEGNSAVGGLDLEFGDGAGVYIDDEGVLTITNSTLALNNAIGGGGGIYQEPGGTGRANSITVTANSAAAGGGGIQLNGTPFELLNSIVAGNTSAGTPSDCGGDGFTGDAPNLIGTTAGGCSPGAEIVAADPLLAPIDDNGGPTRTVLPAAASPAIGASDTITAPAADQRGLLRDSAPDLGAVERQPSDTP